MAELIIFICDFLAISIGCVAVLLYYFCGKHFAEFVRKTSREGAGVSGHYVLTDSKRARSAKNESVNSINNINEHSTPRRERDTMLHDESRED